VTRVLALTGGVGGAKLVLGLARSLADGELTVIVNTGDDFTHLGLYICPDVDTTLYTLANVANPELGWGRCDETWSFMSALEEFGAERWFRLGDKDLALHVTRTARLAQGERLTHIVRDFAHRLAIPTLVLPMSDAPVRTVLVTDKGDLPFQHYFVRDRCEPRVRAIRYEGAGQAAPTPEILDAFRSPALETIVVCPSNPYLSIDPILAVPGLRALLSSSPASVVAVTPLIGGKAVKGPTAKIMGELGIECSPRAIAAHYEDFLDGFVLDARDTGLARHFDLPLHVSDTLMQSLDDRLRLARQVLNFAAGLKRQRATIREP
jgi:LPPG:FO 2-phospho-L-lactate transferase